MGGAGSSSSAGGSTHAGGAPRGTVRGPISHGLELYSSSAGIKAAGGAPGPYA